MSDTSVHYNYKYTIDYLPINEFNWHKKTKLLKEGLKGYDKIIMPQIPKVIELLNKDRYTRQAVISCNQGIEKFNSCFMYSQYQFVKHTLVVYCYYRSEHRIYGRYLDIEMQNYLITKIIEGLTVKPLNVIIEVIVGNYHNYEV